MPLLKKKDKAPASALAPASAPSSKPSTAPSTANVETTSAPQAAPATATPPAVNATTTAAPAEIIPAEAAPAPAPERTISEKALKVLGATEEEVRLERAILYASPEPSPDAARIFVEYRGQGSDEPAPPKEKRLLGVPSEQPLEWLQRQQSETSRSAHRRVPSKALLTLGATIDDLRIEKALLVLGEAPGREIPAGKLPRPRYSLHQDPIWAVAPERPQSYSGGIGISVFLCAFLPWGILAPLNVLKLQLNKVSPGAHLWVPPETEQCQAACGIARMWASLFWSMQFANAVACVYLHHRRERGLAMLGVSHKLVVGGLLLKAYIQGVVYWPIGLVGGALEWLFAAAFIQELRKP